MLKFRNNSEKSHAMKVINKVYLERISKNDEATASTTEDSTGDIAIIEEFF